jgi:glycosidase
MTKTITDGNGTTHFFDVYPAKRTRNVKETIGRSMLFIPLAATPVEQMTVLVYYHGHHGPSTIEGYVGSIKERDFRPKLKSKKVLLIEPQGGPVSRFGALATPAGLTTLLDQAMFIAMTYGPPVRSMPALGTPAPKPKSLIIAGFSGGGYALNNTVLDSKEPYLNQLTEAWSFDSMYWGEGQRWVDWAIGVPSSKKLRVRVTAPGGGETTGAPRSQHAVIMKGVPTNVDMDAPIATTHEKLPGLFVDQWL